LLFQVGWERVSQLERKNFHSEIFRASSIWY
jgi:hypothetical protein